MQHCAGNSWCLHTSHDLPAYQHIFHTRHQKGELRVTDSLEHSLYMWLLVLGYSLTLSVCPKMIVLQTHLPNPALESSHLLRVSG